ncbi:MAG: saccharopine dehydrogenase [Marinilabiliales bacterium]|nr:MAG: saccharopine dehydrogenase [Marinilabiliales bacterium]
MKRVLVLGAGLSASSLIKYLLENSEKHDWKIAIADVDLDRVMKKIDKHPNGEAYLLDAADTDGLDKLIEISDLVISLLPASMHYPVAKRCVDLKKHMVTASYVSDEMKSLNEEAKAAGVILLNEIGVDPGIDHMSAMQVMDKMKEKGWELEFFESSTGGLVAPESDNNPWNYKFTWNPRNVVLAGQGISRFIRNGKLKFIPYHKLFERVQEMEIPDFGEFEYYANRDSLKYRKVYNIEGIPTIFRGTIRRKGYCEAWNCFVQLGATDDSYTIESSENMTYREFINSFLKFEEDLPVEDKLAAYLNIDRNSEIMKKLEWLGIFEEKAIGLKEATPAQILQQILETKWSLDPEDKDMIVMRHRFHYKKDGKKKEVTSSMVTIGKDTTHTAMSITVGVPAAIAAKLILIEEITCTGVHIPIRKDIYEPVLKELEEYGILFKEIEQDL